MQSTVRRVPRPLLLAMVVLILASAVPLAQPEHADGFATQYRWPQGKGRKRSYLYFQVNPDIAVNTPGLGAAQQTATRNSIINAATEWNQASRLRFYENSASYDVYFTYAALSLDTNATTSYNGINSELQWPDVSLSSAVIKFNNQKTWTLDVNGYPSIWEVAVHELGHVLSLDDDPRWTWKDGGYNGGDPNTRGQCYTTNENDANCGYSVMWGSHKNYRSTYTDDNLAATMMYGIFTRFEVSEHLGLHTNLKNDQRNQVATYDNCSVLEPADGYWYWTSSPAVDTDVPSSPTASGASGGRYMRFRGCSRTLPGSEYAYMTLAWAAHDSAGQDSGDSPCFDIWEYACALEITPGLTLSWWQYNKTPGSGYAAQCTAGIDLELLTPSGTVTTLRDMISPATGTWVKDTNGIRAHPASRLCDAAGQNWRDRWYRVNIDLDQLVGYKILRYMVAYDNGATNSGGKWRIYFDDLKILDV